MKRILLSTAIALFCVTPLLAQENTPNTNTLEGQFADVIEGSNNYQEFKVIKKTKINRLRQNILDTVAALETKITASNSKINSQQAEIATLKTNLGATEENLTISREKEGGIELLGILTDKTTYNTILFSIIGLLLLTLGFFIFKFKNSNSVTKAAQSKLDETESEFEAHRQKKLEEIQQIRRKLQDEINKNRKVQ